MESEDLKILPSPEVPHESKEARKKQEKDRKKGEKKMDQFIKSIANCTPEEKVDALCKKNSESLDQVRTLKSTVQILQRKVEQLQNDQSKGVLARSRLETLCRELQRQNKSIKDESMQKIREEEEKRKEVSTRFQSALNEVSVMMQQNTDKNLKLRDDNIEISNKFQKLCDQFKQREEEVIRLTKQMDLEKQLAEATVKRIECQLKAEQGIWAKEKEHYAAKLKFHEEEKLKFETNIKNLEEHLSLYSNKYSDFESTIAKSNAVFDNYKVELNRMSKQIQKLEQENNIWKEKWLQSQHAFTNVTLEHRTCEQSMVDRDRKLKQLADLCRSIQEERSAYLKQLKENGLTPVVVVVEKPAIVEPEKPKNNVPHKMTKKEKQLSLLKKEMQAIEKQLTDTLKSSQNETNGKESTNSSQEAKKIEEGTTDGLVSTNQKETVTEKSATSKESSNDVKNVEEGISDSVVSTNQQKINSENSTTLPEIVENDKSTPKLVDDSSQNQSEENTAVRQEASTTKDKVESNSVDSANQNQKVSTESNESREISSKTEENTSVPDLVNNTDSESVYHEQKTLAKEENKGNAVENANPVCVTSEEEQNSPAQSSSESPQAVKNADTNKNKPKGQKSKKNKK